MADVLISGGGPAGSALAILLGRRGFTVELFERGQFPKEKPCGEGLMPAGVAALERLGVAEAAGGAPFYGVRYHFGSQTAEGRFPATAGIPSAGRGQRRRTLDHVLFRAAGETPRVTARAGVCVEAPLVENGRVIGLMVEGELRRASLVVAADGVNSLIRHALGLNVPARRKRFGIRTHFRLSPGMDQPPWVDVFAGRGYELYVTPLPEREVLVAGLADEGAASGPIEQAFLRWIAAQPLLAARLEGAERLTSFQGRSPLVGRARRGVAPGIVLLGDAAGFLDPITGGGMTQALLSAELLAECVLASGREQEEDAWMRRFERARQSLLRDYHILTRMVLWLADHPRLAERAVAALGGAPALFSHLVGVSGGVRRLLGSEIPRGAGRRAPRAAATPRVPAGTGTGCWPSSTAPPPP